MASNRRTSTPAPRSDDFWNYVPDPSRTVFYLLLAVMALASAEWIPKFAAQVEQTRMLERRQEVRERLLADLERWRRQYPGLEQQYEEHLAQETRQAELEAETEYQFAQPSPMPMPMPMRTEESASQALWN